jgi:hypothetical protein
MKPLGIIGFSLPYYNIINIIVIILIFTASYLSASGSSSSALQNGYTGEIVLRSIYAIILTLLLASIIMFIVSGKFSA